MQGFGFALLSAAITSQALRSTARELETGIDSHSH